jgi:hypothetical protein
LKILPIGLDGDNVSQTDRQTERRADAIHIRPSFSICDLNLFTHSTQQSPSWEANRFSASQEIPRILWNPKVHYRIHKCLLPIPILSQLDPVHNPTFHFLKIHLNIIFPFILKSPSGFSYQNPVYPSSFTPYLLHALPISFFSILSPENYLVSRADH